jgi:hypothetical protein
MSPVKLVFAVTLLLLQPITSYAQEFYYGFSIGHGSLREISPTSNTDQIAADLIAPEGLSLVGQPTANFIFDVDDKDLNWKLYGGYNINRNLGIEAGYINLGKSIISSTLSGNITATLPAPLAGTQTSQATLITQNSISNTGFHLNGVFRYPVIEKFNRSTFSVFAKAGVIKWNSGGNIRQTLIPFSFQTEVGTDAPEPVPNSSNFKDGNNGFNFVFGAGADYLVTADMGIRGEWSYYRGINGRNLNLFSLGAFYLFQL